MGEKRDLRAEAARHKGAAEYWRTQTKNLRQVAVDSENARKAAHDKLTGDIMREMIDKPFTIVTASGKVIDGQATSVDVQTSQSMAWGQFGEVTRSAQITLHPKHG